MSVQQFLIVVIAVGVFYAAYTSHRAKNKVYCTFTRRDKTTGHKWAKAKNGERIEFAGGWYYIDMECVTTEALDSGFNMIFPTMVRRLFFRCGNKYPLNPKTGKDDWETPEARKNLNKREDIEALELGSRKALGAGKVSMFGGGLLPIILIVGLIAVIYFIFQMRGQIDQIGNALNVLQQMMMKK